MQYKTDQKEKFTVLTFLDSSLTPNLVPEINDLTQKILSESPKNLVLNCSHVTQWDSLVIEALGNAQQQFYDNNASFVICALSNDLQNSLDATDFAEMMNLTPTETEAWDIVQMEEIERELLDSDDMEFSAEA
ncbi:MAG: STAS domain-containing protein [Bacteroidetes bacterium]|nr:STAS domain-containing protein [Bacteroidota bacterium]